MTIGPRLWHRILELDHLLANGQRRAITGQILARGALRCSGFCGWRNGVLEEERPQQAHFSGEEEGRVTVASDACWGRGQCIREAMPGPGRLSTNER